MVYFFYHCSFFFFNDPASTEIYTLSLHDALPISQPFCLFQGRTLMHGDVVGLVALDFILWLILTRVVGVPFVRSEEHTSELQSHHDLVCRLLLEKKKT